MCVPVQALSSLVESRRELASLRPKHVLSFAPPSSFSVTMALQRLPLLPLLVLLFLVCSSHGQSLSIALVQTAQNTTDRLTPQANLTFSSTDPGTIFKVSVDATTK